MRLMTGKKRGPSAPLSPSEILPKGYAHDLDSLATALRVVAAAVPDRASVKQMYALILAASVILEGLTVSPVASASPSSGDLWPFA